MIFSLKRGVLLSALLLLSGAPGTAQTYGGPGNQAYQSPTYQLQPPRRYVLSRTQIAQHLSSAGWKNVRAIARRGASYTALADRYRYTFAPSPQYRFSYFLVIDARSGRVISERPVNSRRN